jgi:(1->4)-alpha-D-glucan 1-alpha-D-glucosylmutase
VKMHVLNRALNARKANPDLFIDGDYQPLEIQGTHKDRVIAFARKHGSDWMISLTVRCVASVQAPIIGPNERHQFWNHTELVLPKDSPEKWENTLTSSSTPLSSTMGRMNLGAAFEGFPLALLLPV